MNGKLNLWASLTEDEWNSLEKKTGATYNDKMGKSLSNILRLEITKKFSSLAPITCEEIKLKKVIKRFELDLSEDVLKAVVCRSYALGISPMQLVFRTIIHPMLNPLEAEDHTAI